MCRCAGYASSSAMRMRSGFTPAAMSCASVYPGFRPVGGPGDGCRSRNPGAHSRSYHSMKSAVSATPST